MSYTIIDVSYAQGSIDWAKVKRYGIDTAIIRVGGRYTRAGTLYSDGWEKRNLKEATKNGFHIGIYFFSQAITEKEAIQEANFTLDKIKDYKIELPVFIDVEINHKLDRLNSISNLQRTKCMVAFMETIKKAGYKTGFYCGAYYLRDNLVQSMLKNYDMWLAQYTTAKKPFFTTRDYQIWQYSSKGKIPGITANSVDMNIGYKEYWKTETKPTLTPKPAKTEKPKDGKLVVDGIFGKASTTALQKWLGTHQDGVISGQSATQKKYLEAFTSIEWTGTGSPCVKALQRYLTRYGYTTTIDGILGSHTVMQLQTFLNKVGKANLTVDGYFGKQSARAFQDYLNKVV